MKKLLITLLFITISVITYSQSLVFEAQYGAVREYNEAFHKFEPWPDWKACKIKVIFNPDNKTIEVFAEYQQKYEITSTPEKSIYPDKTIYLMNAYDEEGIPCILELEHFEKQEITLLYIRWRNLEVVYQMKLL